MADVGFAACHSSGGTVSGEQCKRRSAVSTSKGLAHLHCSPEFREWLETRHRRHRGWRVRKWQWGMAAAAIALVSISGFYLGTLKGNSPGDHVPLSQNVTDNSATVVCPVCPTTPKCQPPIDVSHYKTMLTDSHASAAELEKDKNSLAMQITDLKRLKKELVAQKNTLERRLEEAEHGIWMLLRIGGMVAGVFCLLLGLSVSLAIRRPFARVELQNPSPAEHTVGNTDERCPTSPVSSSALSTIKSVSDCTELHPSSIHSDSTVEQCSESPETPEAENQSDAEMVGDEVSLPAIDSLNFEIHCGNFTSSSSCTERGEEDQTTVLKDVTSELQREDYTSRDLDILKQIKPDGERNGESSDRNAENEVPSATKDDDLEEIRCAGDVTSPIADRIRAVPRGIPRGPQLDELQRALGNLNERNTDESEEPGTEDPAQAELQCHPIEIPMSTTPTDPSSGPTPDVQSPTQGQAILRAFAPQTNGLTTPRLG